MRRGVIFFIDLKHIITEAKRCLINHYEISQMRKFFKIHPFFIFLARRKFGLKVGVVGHNFEIGPPKDHSIEVWSKLAKRFQKIF